MVLTVSDLLFVAELGTNFFGSIDIAKYLIDQAKESGATHVKMQLWKADDLYNKSWKWYDYAKLCELDYDTARILKEYADSIDIGWFASVDTPNDIDFLSEIKCTFIKIKESQHDNMRLIKYAESAKDMFVIISHPEIVHNPDHGLYNLITTKKYPSKWKDIPFGNFSGKTCSVDGFSDHTQGIQASLCAAMYDNIRIFEQHFTAKLFNKFGVDEWQTPDHCVSIYPEQFKEMVEKISHIKGK